MSHTSTVVRSCALAIMALLATMSWSQVAAKSQLASGDTKDKITARTSDTADKRATAPVGEKSIEESFTIGPDDLLAINVWNEAEITRTVTVRPDGKISVALIGELVASGKTPKQLEHEITSKLAAFVADPTVTVIVQEIRSRKFSVIGKVSHPGAYPLTNTTTVLDAIAVAGGFQEFAKQKAVYVLRQKSDGTAVRLGFNYKEVIQGNKLEQNVRLEPRDTVVVP